MLHLVLDRGTQWVQEAVSGERSNEVWKVALGYEAFIKNSMRVALPYISGLRVCAIYPYLRGFYTRVQRDPG